VSPDLDDVLPDPDPVPDTDRVLTIPNVITVVRLCLLPVFVWLLFGEDDRASAAWLLAALGTTDFFDGYIARHFNQVSELGKVLDPVADRLLFFVGIGSILIDGSIPVWFAVAVLAREALVAAATLALAAMGAARVDVTWFGKAGAFALMMSVPFFLGSHGDLSWADQAEDLAWATGLPGLALAWYSVALYVPLARRALREGRVAEAAT
jgi:cardiolipin synthase